MKKLFIVSVVACAGMCAELSMCVRASMETDSRTFVHVEVFLCMCAALCLLGCSRPARERSRIVRSHTENPYEKVTFRNRILPRWETAHTKEKWRIAMGTENSNMCVR